MIRWNDAALDIKWPDFGMEPTLSDKVRGCPALCEFRFSVYLRRLTAPMDTILVTGGAGFIGSAVVRQLVRDGKRVINLDKLTYAGNPEGLGIAPAANHRLVEGDILDNQMVLALLREERVEGIMHLAAEKAMSTARLTAKRLCRDQCGGHAFRLLDAALEYWRGLQGAQKRAFRFHHISTDEVFGDLPFNGSMFTEDTPYAPSSPYSLPRLQATISCALGTRPMACRWCCRTARTITGLTTSPRN